MLRTTYVKLGRLFLLFSLAIFAVACGESPTANETDDSHMHIESPYQKAPLFDAAPEGCTSTYYLGTNRC